MPRRTSDDVNDTKFSLTAPSTQMVSFLSVRVRTDVMTRHDGELRFPTLNSCKANYRRCARTCCGAAGTVGYPIILSRPPCSYIAEYVNTAKRAHFAARPSILCLYLFLNLLLRYFRSIAYQT